MVPGTVPPAKTAQRVCPRPSDWTFELIEPTTTSSPKRLPVPPRHLPQPAGDHHRRADDGRLRQRGHAGELPPLELRQRSSSPPSALPARQMGWPTRSSSIQPCIAYLMEENTTAMQALVIAHAALWHNSFFKGNYLFRMWTDASSIIDYLVYANFMASARNATGSTPSSPAGLLPRPVQLTAWTATAALQEKPGAEAPSARSAEAHAQQQVNETLAYPSAPARKSRRPKTVFCRAPGKHPVLHRKTPAAGTLAARSGAHRAQDRPVFLPAAPDPGHERGLGHLLALLAAQHPVRRGATSPTA